MATDFYIRSIEITDAAPPAVPGDYDRSDVVDAADLVLWTIDFGQTGDDLTADGDFDADVDGADFLLWQRQLGVTGASAALAAVREPAAGVMLLAGTLALVACRRAAAS